MVAIFDDVRLCMESLFRMLRGYTRSFVGFYRFIELAIRLTINENDQPIRLRLRRDEPCDLVTVDWVSRASKDPGRFLKQLMPSISGIIKDQSCPWRATTSAFSYSCLHSTQRMNRQPPINSSSRKEVCDICRFDYRAYIFRISEALS